MEIIDISKFYRFESIPNPLIFASKILNENLKLEKKFDEYIQINECKAWLNGFSSLSLDNILSEYFKKEKNIEYNDSKRPNSKINLQKNLNKKVLYLIVKNKLTTKDNPSFVILPINSFEHLSNSPVNRLYLHRDGVFEIEGRYSLSKNDKNFQQRFYNLKNLLTTQGIFDSELDIKTKNLSIETEDDIIKRKGLEGKLLGDNPKFYSLSEYELLDYLPNYDPDPEVVGDNNQDLIWIEKYGIPRQDYEYNENEIDNNFFNNPIKYSNSKGQNIFPIFNSLEDAETFLTIAIEDLIEPFKKKLIFMRREDFFSLSRKEQYKILLPTSYNLIIEDINVSVPTKFQQSKNAIELHTIDNKELKKKSANFLVRNPKLTMEEKQKSPYRIENYDINAFIPLSNSFLLKQTMDVNIIEIGLGDFLNFWFSQKFNSINSSLQFEKLNFKVNKSQNNKGEILLIPNLLKRDVNTRKLDKLEKRKNVYYNHYYKTYFQKTNNKKDRFKINYKISKMMTLDDIKNLVDLKF